MFIRTSASIRSSSFRSGKLASLRVGRVENEIAEITQDPEVVKVDVYVIPRNTETDHSVIIKGYHKDGTCPKADTAKKGCCPKAAKSCPAK